MPAGNLFEAAESKAMRAFTLIELLVVLAIVAVLLTLVAPRYFQHVQVAKEAALRENLQNVRRVLDGYFSDHGRYPDSLEELVEKHYLRSLPVDPLVQSADSWLIDSPPDGYEGNIYDVHSSASGTAADGSSYSDW